MLWISLALSALLWLGANVLKKTRHLWAACILCFCGGCLGWPCIMFPALALSGVLMAGLSLAYYFTSREGRYFFTLSLAVVLASHLLIGALSYSLVRERIEMRAEYPVESLAPRLAYEHDVANPLPDRGTDNPPATATKSLQTLEDRFSSEAYSHRYYVLKYLHENSLQDFVDSPGFGISRRIEPRKRDVELPTADPIPLDYPEYEPSSGFSDTPKPQSGSDAAATPANEILETMHSESVGDFANARGFGYVKDREHVRGFQAHQFRQLPQLSEKSKPERWHVQNLQLVSLLKHAEPAVYVSENLPRMEELRGAKTRALDAFEKEALENLRKGEDVKVELLGEQIRMLGSVRAAKQCLDCHQVRRGDLLGAFTYTLVRQTNRP